MEERLTVLNKKEPYQAIYTACVRSKYLTPNEWRVYVALNSFSGCSKIFPSQKTIAKRAGRLGLRTIIRAIDKLVEIGLLKKKAREDSLNKTGTCEYELQNYLEWAKEQNIEIPETLLDLDPEANITYVPEGYVMVLNRFLFCEELDSNELRVYCELFTYRYKGTINPSVSTIAEHCNISERLCYDVITSLERKKLIKRDGMRDEDNGNALLSNSYTIYSYIDWLKQFD